MGSFLGGLTHIIKTGFDLTDTGRRFEQDKQQKEDRDNELTKFAVDNGAKPVMGGMVNDAGILRPPDKTRVITHKRADGQKVQLELATPEEQRKRQTMAHVQTLLDEFQGTSGIRKTEGDESVDLAGRTQTARNTSNRADEEMNRKTNGIAIPQSLAEGLGISPEEVQKHGNYLPSELSNLAHVDDNIQQANARKAKPTRTVQSTKEIENDNGNVSQIVTFSDGTSETRPLGAIGKKTKPTGALSEFEKYKIGRQGRLDAVASKDKKGIATAQAEMETIGKSQAALVGTHDKAQEEYTQLQTALGAQSGIGPFKSSKLTGKDRKKAEERSKELVGIMAGAQSQHALLESQKQAANKRREQLMGGGSSAADSTDEEAIPQTGNAAAAASKQAASPVTVMLPTGQPATFPNAAAAADFKKKHGLK